MRDPPPGAAVKCGIGMGTGSGIGIGRSSDQSPPKRPWFRTLRAASSHTAGSAPFSRVSSRAMAAESRGEGVPADSNDTTTAAISIDALGKGPRSGDAATDMDDRAGRKVAPGGEGPKSLYYLPR